MLSTSPINRPSINQILKHSFMSKKPVSSVNLDQENIPPLDDVSLIKGKKYSQDVGKGKLMISTIDIAK